MSAEEILREVLAGDEVEQALRAAGLPTPIRDRAGLLDAVREFVGRYVVLNYHQLTAIALWVAHCHALDAAEVTPYLAITSPVKRCGKTRLLEAVGYLVPRPLLTSNVSDSALFRFIDEEKPVILLDETDAIFGPKSNREDLRSLVNAGFERGGMVIRCEGDGKKMTVRKFNAFSAKAIAGIGELPDTIADRSIPIRLQRKSPQEKTERFRRREARQSAEPIREALEAWAAANVDILREARPQIPEQLNDRAQDGWEALLAIADLAGGEWPEAARAAALALHEAQEDESYSVRLLADIKATFDEGRERMASADLAKALCGNEETPWGDIKGKPLDARGLAWRLKPFEIRPKQLRIGEKKIRGYERDQFTLAWSRYLSRTAYVDDFERYTGTPQVNDHFSGFSNEDCETQKTGSELACTDVPDKLPVQGVRHIEE